MKLMTNSLCILILSAFILTSCGYDSSSENSDGQTSTIEKADQDVKSQFYALESHYAGDINISFGTEQSVSFNGEDHLVESTSFKVKKGKAIIRGKDHKLDYSKVKVNIVSPGLQAVYNNGSSDISVEGKVLNREDITLVSKGSGNMSIDDFNKDQITILSNGSGDIKMTGSSDIAKIYIKGSGDVDMAQVLSKDIYVDVTGSGDAKVNASEKADCKIYGSGDIYLSGDAEVAESIKGSGDLIRQSR